MFDVIKQSDRSLLGIFCALSAIGLVMMFSSSVDFSNTKYGSAFFHLERQILFWLLALVAALVTVNLRLDFWQKYSWLFLLGSFFLLILVVIPGIGKEVNGSRRWLNLGFFNLQSSEFAKVGILIYLADYLTRRQQEIRTSFIGMIKPMLILGVMIVLLLLEPDFGSVVVMGIACMSMIFISGARLLYFLGLLTTCAVVGSITIFSSVYRMRRLSCFLDPWEQPYDCGYQLTQSLIAIGRGEWFGTGLGNSVQKLFYLPESHTDFVFAILAEELGLVGGFVVIALFAALIVKIIFIARKAELAKRFFSAYLAYGTAVLLALQVFINVGVNTGLLPTKGLTLPLFSYGGSSLLVTSVLLALVLRADYETRAAGNKSSSAKKLPLPRKILQGLSYE